MGHYRAATALAEQILAENPTALVRVIDIYELAFPRHCQHFYKIYDIFLSRGLTGACKLYNFAYTRTVYKEHGLGAMHSFPKRYIQNRLARYLASNRPDAVVSTYSFCSQLMADYKHVCGDDIPLITCVTDVTSHNLWTNPNTDLYLVAAGRTRRSLMSQGVAPEKIAISGIPVSKNFCRNDTGEVQNPHKELLIMGGGLGMLPTERSFYEQLNRVQGLHTTIIAGRNRKLARAISGRWPNITVLGFTDRVDEYMRRADLLITKPGGISMFEAIQTELPLLIFTPYLEQEINNAAFLTSNSLAVLLEKRPKDAVNEIVSVINDEALLRNIKSNMRMLKTGLNEQALSGFLESLTRTRETLAC
jgi:UDP-N-acetylglucosamine:LPS N-acetylglucosamine transferase